MKGIILAAGLGTRLRPSTNVICKPLLPIYDKPMIYYPLATLISAGIDDILIITPEAYKDNFIQLLGDGSQLGIKISYEIQFVQKGIADAFMIGEKFIGDDNVCLILCDNIFYGEGFGKQLKISNDKLKNNNEAVIFGYKVPDPRQLGVVEFDDNNKVLSIEEKPQNPKSDYAIPGLYFLTNEVIEIAKQVKPSARGELEITSVIEAYLNKGNLSVELLPEDFVWMDTGTNGDMYEAFGFVKDKLENENISVGCIEEAAFNNGFISNEDVKRIAEPLAKTSYGKYLEKIAPAKKTSGKH